MGYIKRETKETKIEITSNIYGSGKSKIDTKIGFFDHMLESFAKHSWIDLDIKCDGDIFVDYHHSVEDVGIALGLALAQDIYPVKNIERFGSSSIPMDEALIECSIDISNRPFLFLNVEIDGKVGEFDSELLEEFLRAFVYNLKISCHINLVRGKNRHHIIEATFKALAVALRRALVQNQRAEIPSTKGVL